jgi:hypothetical protein
MKDNVNKSTNYNTPDRGPRGPKPFPIIWPPAWLAELRVKANPIPGSAPADASATGKRAIEPCEADRPQVAEPPRSCQPTCPLCRRPLDGKQRCWKCCDRLCADCGKPTGNAFMRYCMLCEVRLQRAGTE